MMRGSHALVLAVVLAVSGMAGCRSQAPAESDERIARLEKDLEEAKKEIEAARQSATPSPSEPVGGQPAPSARPEAPPSAKPEPPPRPSGPAAGRADYVTTEQGKQAAEAYARDRDAARRELDEQKSVNARQAETNAQLQQQLEEMKPREITIPAGTVIPARTTAELSTKTAANGSVFEALLDRDLVVDDLVLARAGARVTCVVVSSDPGGRVKGVASMAVAARSIAGAKGEAISIRTDRYGVEARTTKGKDAARTGVMAGAGAIIGGIAGGGKGAAIGAGAGAAAGVGTNMATRGEAAVIPAETLIQFRLTSPATVVHRR